MQINDLTYQIIGCAYDVHSELGPGLFEKTYRVCLEHVLREKGLSVESELALPVCFRGNQLEAGCRIDLLVEDKVIVELKAVEKLVPAHKAQVITYLRLSKITHGLLFNFNEQNLRNGIQRVINTE
ncbi:MAG: GxxExxY protein [Ignavibacteria bacterium]|nr:MAG: GxxExxY protein [Ignavibacteria bacterium]